MRYCNGREARPGDKVVFLGSEGKPIAAGLLYDLDGKFPGGTARLARMMPGDTCVHLPDCLHADDVAAAFPPGGGATPD